MNDQSRIAQPYPATTELDLLGGFYCILADQINVFPPQDGLVMELTYYQNLTPLSTSDPVSWLSDSNPDLYLFGLLVEISSFIKNPEAKAVWEGRYLGAIDELQDEDSGDRWSGTPLQITLS